jgi:flagellar protein FlgJ
MTPEIFLSRFVGFADQVQTETGIPAEMALTQAAIESGWGEKAPGNNYFGIRADSSWRGPVVAITTKEEIGGKLVTQTKQPFRAYATPLDSFRDYAAFLAKNKRYAPALVKARAGDVPGALAAVAAAGYATSSKYAALLQSTLQSVRKRISTARALRSSFMFLIFSGTVGAFFLR